MVKECPKNTVVWLSINRDVDSMVQSKRQFRKVFDPRIGDLVAEYETTSDRVRSKLADPLGWCFCELCGQITEFALATSENARGFYKRNCGKVSLSQALSAKAEKIADDVASRYELALTGDSPDNPVQLIIEYCGINGFRKLISEERSNRDNQSESSRISVEQLRHHVKELAQIALCAKRSDFIGAMPHPDRASLGVDATQKTSRAGEPSRLYCERHNQRRSDDARRAYQRDIELVGQYHMLIEQIWSEGSMPLPAWDIKVHALVRQEAYRRLQEAKPRHKRLSIQRVDALISQGITNQAEIARQLGVSRQAVSAALKRREREITSPTIEHFPTLPL